VPPTWRHELLTIPQEPVPPKRVEPCVLSWKGGSVAICCYAGFGKARQVKMICLGTLENKELSLLRVGEGETQSS
jgi:hypothetical protein